MQVWRHAGDPCNELYEMLRPEFARLPDRCRTARSFHIGVHPLHPPLELLGMLRQAAHSRGGLLSVEPYTCAEEKPTPEQLRRLLSAADIFSPNQLEAESMVGSGEACPGPPSDLLSTLLLTA